MNPAKQSQILNAFEFKHLDVLGISETKLSLSASLHSFKNTNLFSSWWSHHPSRQTSGGVGLIIRQPLALHVQKVIKWQGRVIYADLYFTSHRFKIINAYVPPASAHNRQERKDTHAYLKSLLSSTLSSNMLMGDLNVCPNKYFTLVSSGLSPSPTEFDLYNFLTYHNFTNNSVIHNDTHLPTHVYHDSVNNNTRYSRLDHIWLSPNFPLNDLIHSELWNSEDFYSSDHLMLIMHFSSQNIYSTIANARLNQKNEKRTIIHFRNVTPSLWEEYQNKMDSGISVTIKNRSNANINIQWLDLKKLMYTLALDLFPTHTVSNTSYQRLPDDLYTMKLKLASLSRILALHNGHNLIHSTSKITDTWSSYLAEIDSIATSYDLKDSINLLIRYFPLSAHSNDITMKLKDNRRILKT